MVLFPFSIADIDNPEHIRVVLYASGRMAHAPLNALLNQAHQNMSNFDKQQSKNIALLSQRIDALEKQLKTTRQSLEELKQKAK
ncbi:putative RNase H-like nuclease (RuvC/YqgF family) [Bartonella japonica]|uniref:RNase H-like nuclease (RuvC/YqgF family) n=1 Tax=Bartonella japonica TaxID=357761 RepID=A0ABV2FPV3_9HYPH